ncbi:MAG: preprotein translocase subunit YajC [Rikenellaceae bacterium]
MMNLLQVAPPEATMYQQFSPYIMIALMILVLWLFMWRPEAKRRKEMEAFRSGLKKGDKIVTAGGIYGIVKEVKETTLLIEVDSNVTLRVDKTMVVADAATAAAAAQVK